MLKMENVSKAYKHRGQTVTALDNARSKFHEAISSRW